jgi:hypothetical protein
MLMLHVAVEDGDGLSRNTTQSLAVAAELTTAPSAMGTALAVLSDEQNGGGGDYEDLRGGRKWDRMYRKLQQNQHVRPS